jgi:hypothetical protein
MSLPMQAARQQAVSTRGVTTTLTNWGTNRSHVNVGAVLKEEQRHAVLVAFNGHVEGRVARVLPSHRNKARNVGHANPQQLTGGTAMMS